MYEVLLIQIPFADLFGSFFCVLSRVRSKEIKSHKSAVWVEKNCVRKSQKKESKTCSSLG